METFSSVRQPSSCCTASVSPLPVALPPVTRTPGVPIGHRCAAVIAKLWRPPCASMTVACTLRAAVCCSLVRSLEQCAWTSVREGCVSVCVCVCVGCVVCGVWCVCVCSAPACVLARVGEVMLVIALARLALLARLARLAFVAQLAQLARWPGAQIRLAWYWGALPTIGNFHLSIGASGAARAGVQEC